MALRAASSPEAPDGAIIRVLLVEDHRIYRDGLRCALPPDLFAVVGEVASGRAAVLEAARQQPDVVLLDLHLPDLFGTTVCAEILERSPATTVIVLSADSDEASVRAALDAGARSYLLKDRQDLDLADTIRRVLDGESIIDPRAATVLLRNLSRVRDDPPRLSEQELKILRLAAEGLSNREIGLRLCLSRHTVKEYLSNAMRKLNATSRLAAVLEASRHGLVDVFALEGDDGNAGRYHASAS